MASERELPAVGALLGGGKYRIVRHVGVGGMGAVYEATNLDTTRRVAIKVLHPDLASRPDVLRRFVQEARAACRIDHPNIVQVFDLVQEGTTVFIVEEFLDGEDLKQRVATEGNMRATEALRAIIPVMEALAHAHGRGVIHRDIKPDNIFLARTAKGVVPKVIDFGIARVIDDEGASMQQTAVGEVMGTAYFMSPEQARGDTELVDGRSDVWSLGAVLYFAVSSARPYEAANRHQLLFRIAKDPPRPLIERVRGIAPAYVALVNRALARDLSERFASMNEFLAAARETLAQLDESTEVVSLPPPEVALDEALLTVLPETPETPVAADDEFDLVEFDDPPTRPIALPPTPPPVPVTVVAPAPVIAALPAPVIAAVAKPPAPLQMPEITPASWETDDDAPAPKRRVPRGVWAAVFAAAVALGAWVALDARAPTPQPTASPSPAVVPEVPTPAVAAPAPSAPDAGVEPTQRPSARATSDAGAARRWGGAAAARPARGPRLVPLAPNPYNDEPPPPRRPMPPGLWAPR
jgi:serine/threonine-protein kinase